MTMTDVKVVHDGPSLPMIDFNGNLYRVQQLVDGQWVNADDVTHEAIASRIVDSARYRKVRSLWVNATPQPEYIFTQSKNVGLGAYCPHGPLLDEIADKMP